MSETYLTAAAYGEAEYVDKKSRFIGHVQPVTSEAEAKAFIEDIRALQAEGYRPRDLYEQDHRIRRCLDL